MIPDSKTRMASCRKHNHPEGKETLQLGDWNRQGKAAGGEAAFLFYNLLQGWALTLTISNSSQMHCLVACFFFFFFLNMEKPLIKKIPVRLSVIPVPFSFSLLPPRHRGSLFSGCSIFLYLYGDNTSC